MINVSFEENTAKGILSLKINGHAGQASKGYDIVCAAASILAYTLAQAIASVYESGGLCSEPQIAMNEGNAEITVSARMNEFDDVRKTFELIAIGYKLIAHNYPQYVNLIMFGQPERA